MGRIGKCPNCRASIPREWAAWAGWGLALLLLVVLVWPSSDPAGSPEDEPPPAAVGRPPVPSPGPTSARSRVAEQSAFPPGSLAVLRADGAAVIPAGGTEEAFQRMGQLAAAEDRDGVRELIFTGQMLTVADGTRCRVVAMDGTRGEVELLTGTYAGRRCFLMPKYVSKE